MENDSGLWVVKKTKETAANLAGIAIVFLILFLLVAPIAIWYLYFQLVQHMIIPELQEKYKPMLSTMQIPDRFMSIEEAIETLKSEDAMTFQKHGGQVKALTAIGWSFEKQVKVEHNVYDAESLLGLRIPNQPTATFQPNPIYLLELENAIYPYFIGFSIAAWIITSIAGCILLATT